MTEDVGDMTDAVRLAVCYRLITEEVLSAVNNDAVGVVVVDNLTVTSAVGVRFLRHTGNPYGNLAH